MFKKICIEKAVSCPPNPKEFDRKCLVLVEKNLVKRYYWLTLRRNPVKSYKEGDKRFRYISQNDMDDRNRGEKVVEQYTNNQWVHIPHESNRYSDGQLTTEEMKKIPPAKLIGEQFDRAKLLGMRMQTISDRLQDQMQKGGSKIPEWQFAVDNWRSVSRLIDKYRKINPSAFDDESVYDRVVERDELLDNIELELENADRLSKSVNV